MITHGLSCLIRERSYIAGLIGAFVQFCYSVSNYVGLCPFQKKKTPSFDVSPSKGRYKCFRYGRSVDVPEFVKEFNGLSFNEALSFLGEGCVIIHDSPRTKTDYMLRKLYKYLKLAMRLNHGQPKSSEGVKRLDYLKHGEPEQLADTFHAGYAGNNNGLHHTLKDNYSNPPLENAGLIKHGNKKDFFRDWIIFPAGVYSGRVKGFKNHSHKPGINIPKCFKQVKTGFYNRSFYDLSPTLHGLYKAKQVIKPENAVYTAKIFTGILSLWIFRSMDTNYSGKKIPFDPAKAGKSTPLIRITSGTRAMTKKNARLKRTGDVLTLNPAT